MDKKTATIIAMKEIVVSSCQFLKSMYALRPSVIINQIPSEIQFVSYTVRTINAKIHVDTIYNPQANGAERRCAR